MGYSDLEIIHTSNNDRTHPNEGNMNSTNSPMGTLYIEARVKSEYNGGLSKLTSKLTEIFNSESVLVVQLDEEMIGAALYAECFFPDCLQSLKAVDLMSANDDSEVILVEDYKVVINAYKMRDHEAVKIHVAMSLCGDAKLLPSAELHGAWERLIFNQEIKQNLVVFMANLLRFSYGKGHKSSSTVNRLILLSGPPGTGKTSLSTSLAQKLAIRLNNTFHDTILLQLNAATLLSQYFGQSAVKIHSIFEALAAQSEELPKTLMILLIDEIESLAASREMLSARNEVHDAVRATNALLTGFDMVKNNANILIICTSNLSTSLDAAFVDRCSRHIKIPQPSIAARYEILRHSLNGLVEREVIQQLTAPLPSFKGAECRLPIDYETAGCALRRLAERLETNFPNGEPASARWLSQLAEISLANELAPEAPCTVLYAVELMERYIDATCGYKRSKENIPTVDLEDFDKARQPRRQVTNKSPNKRSYSDMFGKIDPATLIRHVDEQLASSRGYMTGKGEKPTSLAVESTIDEAIWMWENEGGCNCSRIIQDKLRDYIEHGTPIEK